MKRKMILIGAVITAAILFIIYIPFVLTATNSFQSAGNFNLMSTAFTVIAYAGYALTSTMFNELNSVGSANHFITLPASSFEKLFSAWLVSYVGFSIVGGLALYILSLILGFDSSVFLKMDVAYRFLVYSIFQSIFFIGAIYFKANNFLSTVVSILSIVVMFALIVLAFDYSGLSFKTWSISKLLVIEKANSGSEMIKNIAFTIFVSLSFMWITLSILKKRQIT